MSVAGKSLTPLAWYSQTALQVVCKFVLVNHTLLLVLYYKHVYPACRRDVASCGRIIWEGYMGAQEPAFLMRSTVNLEQTGSPRHEHLSTGLYTLMDVVCSGCHSPMGWQYLQASHEVSN